MLTWHHRQTCDENENGDNLKCNWELPIELELNWVRYVHRTYSPPNLSIAIVDESHSEPDPVGNNDSKNIQGKFTSDEGTPRRMCSNLRRPYWYNGIEATSTNAVDDSSTTHPDDIKMRNDYTLGVEAMIVPCYVLCWSLQCSTNKDPSCGLKVNI